MERELEPFRDRIRYIRQENAGPSAARNRGLAQARGKYVALLDGDDLYLPEYIERQLGRLEQDPEIDLLYPNGWMFEEGKPGRVASRGPAEEKGKVDLLALVLGEKVITNPATIRRQVVEKAGGWDLAIRHSEDLDLYLRIAALGAKIEFHPVPLACYRIREGSQTEATQSMLSGQIYAFEKALRTLQLSPQEEQVLRERRDWAIETRHFFAAKAAFFAGDAEKALVEFKSSGRNLSNWKVGLTIAGLRLTPKLMLAMGRWWQKKMERRAKQQPIRAYWQ